ncbi:MAG: ABC transporter substrate-binding protein [Betaproteobacteria bacterium]
MIDRRTFVGTVAGGLLGAPFIADAQQAGKLPVVGVLVNNAAGSVTLDAFTKGLRDLGYVAGKNIIIDIRSADGKPGALPGLAADLVQRGVDTIFASGPAAIRAARDATAVTPIVAMDLETDPVEAGWVKSLARPGGNLTGLFLNLPGLAGKWLELLKAAAPGIRRVGLLWDSTTGSAQLAAAKSAAPAFAIDLQVMEVRRGEEIDAALRAGVGAGSRALVVLSSPAISNHQQRIADFALKNRLPAISPFRIFTDAGGLLAYGPDFNDMRRRAASYVDKILKGAKLGDLPIEQPTKYEMVINLKTAKALGLTIPQTLLLRADEVIQ